MQETFPGFLLFFCPFLERMMSLSKTEPNAIIDSAIFFVVQLYRANMARPGDEARILPAPRLEQDE